MTRKTYMKRNITTLGLIAFSLAISLVSVCSLQANDEKVFNDAIKYTVEIRTKIKIPFIEDENGVFYGAGFLIDKKRGWILTNAHVASYSPSEIRVAFYLLLLKH